MLKRNNYLIFIIFLFFLSVSFTVKADDGYNYSYYGQSIASAKAMIYKTVVTEEDLYSVDENGEKNTIEIGELVDIFIHNDMIYIVDSKLNKIIVLDSDYHFVRQYPSQDSLDEDQQNDEEQEENTDNLLLKEPKGIYVNDDMILIADYGNGRILRLDSDFNYVTEFGKPNDVTFQDGTVSYKPLKVTVDQAGRIYVISEGIFEGIIELNENGEFNRYLGVNNVSISPLELIWMRFMTEEQRDKMQLSLPPSFVNMFIDKDGFIFAVSKPASTSSGSGMIKRLNAKGINVLKQQGYFEPKGDIEFPIDSNTVPFGPSNLVDISVNNYGLYSVLDKKRGRIFTYDYEGNLLYISGQNGSQKDSFTSAESLTYFGEDILVVDSANKTLVVYTLTEFGKLINDASRNYYYGDYDKAAEKWHEVLKYNTNYYLAYRGIGKSELLKGNYKSAMEYFELADDKVNYSKAYKEYRVKRLETFFPLIMFAVVSGIGYLFYSSIKTNIKINKETGRGDEYYVL